MKTIYIGLKKAKIKRNIFLLIAFLLLFHNTNSEITKLLNNIIVFGDSTYRYINFATYESGDMVVETTCFPISKKRMFFGLKQNGRPFFTKNGENIFFSTDIINNSGKVEAEGAIIKLSTAESNEYFMSISKLEMNAEIIDFNTGTIYFKSTAAFTFMYEVKTLRHAFIPLESN